MSRAKKTEVAVLKTEVAVLKEGSRDELLAAMAEGKREPNQREMAAIAAARESRKARPARAAFAEHPDSTGKQLNLECPHSDPERQLYRRHSARPQMTS